MNEHSRSLRRCGRLVLACVALGSGGTALAQPQIDRVQCSIEPVVDDLGNARNRVQIRVEVDSPDPTLPIDVWVTNNSVTTYRVSPAHAERLPVDGTVTAEWSSAPDLSAPGVMFIDSSFVEPGETITAAASVPGTATVTTTCLPGARPPGAQISRVCRQMDVDRGRCATLRALRSDPDFVGPAIRRPR